MTKQERATKFLEEFKEKVRANDKPFQMEFENDYNHKSIYSFMREKVGTATFIYMRHVSEESDLAYIFSGYGSDNNVVAIVTEEAIYIHGMYFFRLVNPDIWPEGVYEFDAALKEMNNRVETGAFAAFYESLPINNEVVGEDECHQARQRLFNKSASKPIFSGDFFSDEQMVKILCGFLDAEAETEKKLNGDKDSWISRKTFETMVTKLIAEGKAAEPWEITLANAINGIDAVLFTVEFEMDGKVTSGKMEPRKIRHNLTNYSKFDEFDFSTRLDGKRVMAELGVESYSSPHPTCENITRVMYRGKTIYKRNA